VAWPEPTRAQDDDGENAMTAPGPADLGPQPTRLPTEPTIRTVRPPLPGTADRAAPLPDRPSPDGPSPEAHPADQPTVGLPGRAPAVRLPTIRFGKPTPVRVTVTARRRPKRYHRTWPWIAAVALALVVLGVVLLVMLFHGATLSP
jgi:hypothetical protein